MVKREGEVEMKIMVPAEVKALLKSLAYKVGVRQSDLCAMWMSMIDVDHPLMVEKILHMQAAKEVDRLSSTRNALIAKLHGKNVMKKLVQLDNDELEKLVSKIQRKTKRLKKEESK